MGWALTGLGVVLAIVLAAGAALALYRRYCGGWQWSARNVWNVCEAWRQRLSWLWAPREEKVGLVKAQHPTAQTVPGLYREAGNTSQYLLHSESDLRLDAQGAFTRFEAVDRDLHPPLGAGNTIPPQPLRPAPQPRSTARPRPSPLQASSTMDTLRMQEVGPGPLTPPPQPKGSLPPRLGGPINSAPSVFLFQAEPTMGYGAPVYEATTDQSSFPYDDYSAKTSGENAQTAPHSRQSQVEAKLRYSVQGGLISENVKMETNGTQAMPPYGSYDIVQKPSQQHNARHVRNDSKGSQSSFGLQSTANTTAQTIMESIYGPHAASKMLQNSHNSSLIELEQNTSIAQQQHEFQNMEMTPLRNSSSGSLTCSAQNSPAKPIGLQRATQFVQSLPDNLMYETDRATHPEMTFYRHTNGQSPDSTAISPAPPDPPSTGSLLRKNGPTTGERIFNALRSVTSQSYIDASEFYNSVLSSAQQVQRFTFPPPMPSSTMDGTREEPSRERKDTRGFYGEAELESSGLENSRRSSDLYSPELNLEAHRTAQEVYNSLQDPPSSPLLLKDLSQEPHPYMMDPSFTRTSEDIFNSLEERRKSMERLNGLHESVDLESIDTPRRRTSQDLYAAIEEVQMKRRLSQSFEESHGGCLVGEIGELTPSSRRGSQGPEPEPPPDELTLKRAVSCDSVCSDTSVVLGDLEDCPVVGHICVGLEHERWGGRGADCEGDLTVSVLEARDLIAPDGTPAQDTFARVCLLPDRQTHVQTRLYRGSPSPSYQEKFLFPLDGGPTGRTLLVEVFSIEISMGGGASLLGEASLKLGPAHRPPATTWLPLSGPSLPTPHLGELMFSLSYLPTAERLTLVVVKARNLKGGNLLQPGEFFVKVYLLQQGKKLHKKKTSTKRGEKSPIFNEAMIFSVPAHALQTIQLRLTVAETTGEVGANAKAYSVGHVIVGSSASGRSLAHWRQMLAALRRPVAMWHPLRR